MNQKQINSTLNQECNARGEKRFFEIYNDKFIKVAINNLINNHSYHLNLNMLAPWPVRHRNISWQWLSAVVYFSFTTLIYTLYLIYFQDSSKLEKLLPFIVVFLLLSLGTFLMFLYKSPNVSEFKTRYGNCAVLSLIHNCPNSKEFKAFIEEIKLRSLTASQALKIDKKLMLDIEKNELKRIRDEGIINEYDYNEAMARILQVRL